MNNYPPGVTGNEYEIAGPDTERELNVPCPQCGECRLTLLSYRHDLWIACACEWQYEFGAFDPARYTDAWFLDKFGADDED